MSDKFETSKTEGVHAQLHRLTGKWEGTTKVWFEPDKVADESPVNGTIKTILDGRFAMFEYKGSFGGKPLEGLAIYGYHLGLKKYQSAWLDSFHNGSAIMFSESQAGDPFSVVGSYAYVTPTEVHHWRWRTDLVQESDDKVIITAYNISPEGEEVKATETTLNKVA